MQSRSVLVTTQWLSRSLGEPGLALVEVDVDTRLYEKGHVPGAIAWNWTTQLQELVRRDVLSREGFERLMGASGIRRDTEVVLYGDSHNWFAAYAFWLLRLHGHEKVRLLDGGRAKWLREGRPVSTQVPRPAPQRYEAAAPRPEVRAERELVLSILGEERRQLVDVRSPDEFTGRILAPPGVKETALRGGHIPGAKNVPWSQAVDPEDGTFRAPEDLRQVYVEGLGLDPDRLTLTYCRIGERSSHTWFVLKHLLGFRDVRNYDGSWTEYGNLVGVPIER